ncbi:unnamed protein product [Linum trigynum]|uniref:Uncharacterized protein n=1 Tax=Linum trigynum TaxID=586398 RepID=A0AAV2G4R0_9ROSI
MEGSMIPGEEATKGVAADEDQDVESVESLESLFQVAEAADVEEKGGSLNEFRRVLIGMTEREGGDREEIDGKGEGTEGHGSRTGAVEERDIGQMIC